MSVWQNVINPLKNDHRVPLLLSLILSACVVMIVWSVINALTTHHKIITAITLPKVTRVINIAQLHLFGVYTAGEVLSTTSLPLLLQGTAVALDEPTQSRALIAISGQPAKVYQTGDTVLNNVTISRIEKQDVILNDHGVLQKLPLPIEKLNNLP